MESCFGSWNLGLVINLEAMTDSRDRSAATWKVSTSGETITGSSGKGTLTPSGRGSMADCIGKEGSAVLRGLKSPAFLESAHISLSQFPRSYSFPIIALTLT